jgi:F-type H+-transporting ATPase subunit epsilon
MHLEIVTPDRKVFDGEIISVQVPGSAGSFEVFKNHAPIVSSLETGKVRVTTAKGVEYFQIDSGVIEVFNNKVALLAETILK